MNEIERQILENQITILNQGRDLIGKEERILETNLLLNPPKQPTIAERTHDALCEEEKEKVVLAIYNGEPKTKDNISYYRNPNNGEHFDEAPEGYKIVYVEHDVLSGYTKAHDALCESSEVKK